jgi:hypothetical protein
MGFTGLSRRDNLTGTGIGARLLALVVLVALVWQALLVQGHSHANSPIAGTRDVARSAARITANVDYLPAPAVCPLCEEQALSGSYVPIDAVAVPAQMPFAASYRLAYYPAAIATRAYYGWRCRAPPRSSGLI